MCELCEKVKKSEEYGTLLSKMQDSDVIRLEHSKKALSSFSSIQVYSTIEYPKLLIQPMFEPRVAYSNPSNYFQNLFVNGERLPGSFSHGSTRSIFFLGKRLIVFSKSVAMHESEEFLSSLLLAHFEPGEYSFEITPEGRISIAADIEKAAKNLISGRVEKVKISFAFAQDNLQGKLMRKGEAIASALYSNQSKIMGIGARRRSLSTEYMSGYVSTVPYISPHPYLLQILSGLGYSSQQDFQNHVIDYFRAHLTS